MINTSKRQQGRTDLKPTQCGFGCDISPTLLKAAVSGKQQAQRVIFETFKPAVLRSLLGLCHDRELARDLAQDVFIQTFRKLHQVRKPEAFGGWLKQLTIRTGLAHLRQLKSQLPLEHIEMVDSGWHSMADWLTQLDDMSHLINQLQALERSIVWLHVVEGYSHEEIAQLLEQTPANIRQRYRRALLKLYNFLQGEQHES